MLLIGGLDGAAGFSVPILLAEFTKEPQPGLALGARLLPLVATCLVTTLALQWCLRRWGEALGGWLANRTRLTLFRHAEALSIETLSSLHSGYLASLINQVAGLISSTCFTLIWLAGHLTITLTLFFIFTARESIPLAIANLMLLILFVFISLLLSRKIVPLADTVNRTSASLAERFIDLLTNISTVKRLGIVDWAEHKLGDQSNASNRAISALQGFHANRWFLLHSIFFTSYLLTITLLLYRIEAKTLAPSMLLLFVAGFATVRSQAERLSELIKSLLEGNSYVSRLESALEQARPVGDRQTPKLDTIECNQVNFRYPDSEYEISIPEFTLRAGERILITGRSGQGKSTFLTLLANQRLASSGSMLWNGTPYSQFNQSLAHSFALVSQEVELFNLSLRENLTLGRQTSDIEITALLSKLDLRDLLEALPEGLDTLVGEKGLRLSAGQKQRINIARALLLKRQVLLLDEPTSHLDHGSEDRVIECLSQIDPSITLIIVSHRPALRSLCTRTYEFREGTLYAI
jgi:ABC-type bacteriocin/lantibiotic exporter with double-glycine peptidase domain